MKILRNFLRTSKQILGVTFVVYSVNTRVLASIFVCMCVRMHTCVCVCVCVCYTVVLVTGIYVSMFVYCCGLGHSGKDETMEG